MNELTPEMRRFLERLAAGEKPGCVIHRKEDRARQRCRRAGLVFWQSPRWTITDAGRAALSPKEQTHG